MNGYKRHEWAECFDAIASGFVSKPHTARRRARDMARLCPFADVAEAGLAKVKAAIAAHVDMVGPKDRTKWH